MPSTPGAAPGRPGGRPFLPAPCARLSPASGQKTSSPARRRPARMGAALFYRSRTDKKSAPGVRPGQSRRVDQYTSFHSSMFSAVKRYGSPTVEKPLPLPSS